MTRCDKIILFLADGAMEQVVKTLLDKRHAALGITRISMKIEIFTHPNRDPGIYKDVMLIRQLTEYSPDTCIMVVVDEEWSGSPGKDGIKRKIGKELSRNGLTKHHVVVISPSFDSWAWAKHPCLLRELEWEGNYASLMGYLEENGFDIERSSGCVKPRKPKDALEFMLRKMRRPLAREFFVKIAECVGLKRCCLQSFNEFKNVLMDWLG